MRRRFFMATVLMGAFMLLAAFAASADGVTIQYAYWGDQNEENSTNANLKIFMDANPGITVTGIRASVNTDFMHKITTMAASGTLPDVSNFYEPNVLTWGMNGQFVDLTDFYKKTNPKLDAIKFITPDGKIVGISVANEVQVRPEPQARHRDAGVRVHEGLEIGVRRGFLVLISPVGVLDGHPVRARRESAQQQHGPRERRSDEKSSSHGSILLPA
jgi:hypothetical protein